MSNKQDICTFNENAMDMIIPYLFLGNYDSSINRVNLKQKKIFTVIRLLQEYEFDIDNKTEQIKYNVKKIKYGHTYIIDGVKYYHFPIKDKSMCKYNLNDFFNYVNNIMAKYFLRKNNMLVHCKRGHHRSASIVASFIIKYFKIAYTEVVQYINNFRKCALRRDTCISRALFDYTLYLNNKYCNYRCIKKDRVYLCNC